MHYTARQMATSCQFLFSSTVHKLWNIHKRVLKILITTFLIKWIFTSICVVPRLKRHIFLGAHEWLLATQNMSETQSRLLINRRSPFLALLCPRSDSQQKRRSHICMINSSQTHVSMPILYWFLNICQFLYLLRCFNLWPLWQRISSLTCISYCHFLLT